MKFHLIFGVNALAELAVIFSFIPKLNFFCLWDEIVFFALLYCKFFSAKIIG
jgi:hypothetical protein